MTRASALQNQLVAMAIRRLIDKELEVFKGNVPAEPGDQPPESADVKKGLDRAEIAISRAFRRFSAEHCQ